MQSKKNSTIYIIGAGISGLACSIDLVDQNYKVCIYDSSNHAGGRCRSFYDPLLKRYIDNGNHLLLSGNNLTFEYLKKIGAKNKLTVSSEAIYPFVNVKNGKRWKVHFNKGIFPWWILSRNRRIPDSKAYDYLRIIKLGISKKSRRVEDCLKKIEPLFNEPWNPLSIGILNTPGDKASSFLLWSVILKTFARGGKYCLPCQPKEGLSQTFINPATDWLKKRKINIKFKCLLKRVEIKGERITKLFFSKDSVIIKKHDYVVLAIPPNNLPKLLKGIKVPKNNNAIINIHFRLKKSNQLPKKTHLLGAIGGKSHWLFFRNDVVSVTISAANNLINENSDIIANEVWGEVLKALDLPIDSKIPPYKVIKEKRATFSQTPQGIKLRCDTKTSYENLFLAGDWTNTNLPATIEGAVKSGKKAALLITKND